MNAIVCIPTYNESANIERLISAIHEQVPEMHILVIDDASPDGTASIVQRMCTSNPRVHLIERTEKLGLGTAYCNGFRHALDRGFETIMQMDADFSHDPRELPRFLRELENADLIIGSRYVQGVNVINWPMSRLLLSWFANVYTRIITGMPIADATGGYKAFRASMLKRINLDTIGSNGYAFQIEMNYRMWRLGSRIVELPIVFTDRVSGESKMNKSIMWEAAWLVWRLKLVTLFTFGKR